MMVCLPAMPAPLLFPADFLWGAATSAYQVEGSPLADGAGPSIWHHFAHTPGRIADGTTGDVACDHYHRYAEDVKLMQALGLNAYRFSIAWGRILPAGRGAVNQPGLDFYRRLVDTLLEHGIQPCATLYHWDLPAALGDRGGWLNSDMVAWFADYAQIVFKALADRVPMWITLNEPFIVADAGHLLGEHPPGHTDPAAIPRVSRHLLLAHAAAVQAYRAEGRQQIGIAVNLEPKYPASEDAMDQEAGIRAHAYTNRQFLDPLHFGVWPRALHEMFGNEWPAFVTDEVERLRQSLDFVGINYYSRNVVRHDPAQPPVLAKRVRQDESEHTAMDWEVYPQGLGDILRWVADRYPNTPIYITENGAAFDDPAPAADGVDDSPRIAYLRVHLRAVQAARVAGVDVRGYFLWSLLDNFEWSYGHSKRFGIVHVDFVTQRRTPKASARFYAEVIRSRGKVLAAEG
jgi:beta-glucosidase